MQSPFMRSGPNLDPAPTTIVRSLLFSSSLTPLGSRRTRTQVRPWDSAAARLPVSSTGIALLQLFMMLPRRSFLNRSVERGAPRHYRPLPVTPGALCFQRLNMLYSCRSATLPIAASQPSL
ncbi:hypothetical protein NDU88_006828 [Pleurodeles waltl]|uniref:Uncharacterized protein n=1 Tax=Pleurodeles waltl TaxID=8319 RepID=A0AAV7LQ91_PLEWA|nr:hypothetical protein NDU88_006828 [Pleurodeles waltl]